MSLPAGLRRPDERYRGTTSPAWPAEAVGYGVTLLLATIAAWPLLLAQNVQTGAGDWPAHAFRIDQIGRHGLTSWSHTWAGGMPLWEGYQAIPHVLTAGMVAVTGAEVTRVMAVMAGVLLILLHGGVYVGARRLGAAPAGALLAALTAMAIDTVRQPTANFSELWGLALAPVVLYAGFRWAGRPGGLLPAALVGLGVEVHPLLAVTGVIAFVAGYCSSPADRSPRAFAAQGLVATVAAAVFWLPVLVSSRPAYSEPYFTTTAFARLLASLSLESFISGWWIIMLLVALAAVPALRLTSSGGPIRFLLLSAAAICALCLVSLLPGTPEQVRVAQLPRLLSVLPILAGVLAGVLAGEIGRSIEGRRLIWALAAGMATVALVRQAGGPLPVTDGTSILSARALTVIGEAASAAGGRLYADPVATAELSRLSGDRMRLAGSYSGREWSIIHGPVEYFMAGNGAPQTRAAYLMAMGVTAALLPAGARPALAHPATGDVLEWSLMAHVDGFDLLRAPWHDARAWTSSIEDAQGLNSPDSTYRSVEDAYVRDTVAQHLAMRTRDGTGTVEEISYPTPESIIVRITAPERGYLIVNENWDRGWQAAAQGRDLPVERIGLNQIGVDLRGVEGDVEVRLRHRWPAALRGGLLSSILALGLAALVTATGVDGQRRTVRE